MVGFLFVVCGIVGCGVWGRSRIVGGAVSLVVKYYWGREDEAKLLELWRKGVTNVDVLAREFGRKPRAVEMKLKRLGVVAVKPSFLCTTTTERALLENTEIDGKMLHFLVLQWCYTGFSFTKKGED